MKKILVLTFLMLSMLTLKAQDENYFVFEGKEKMEVQKITISKSLTGRGYFVHYIPKEGGKEVEMMYKDQKKLLYIKSDGQFFFYINDELKQLIAYNKQHYIFERYFYNSKARIHVYPNGDLLNLCGRKTSKPITTFPFYITPLPKYEKRLSKEVKALKDFTLICNELTEKLIDYCVKRESDMYEMSPFTFQFINCDGSEDPLTGFPFK